MSPMFLAEPLQSNLFLANARRALCGRDSLGAMNARCPLDDPTLTADCTKSSCKNRYTPKQTLQHPSCSSASRPCAGSLSQNTCRKRRRSASITLEPPADLLFLLVRARGMYGEGYRDNGKENRNYYMTKGYILGVIVGNEGIYYIGNV